MLARLQGAFCHFIVGKRVCSVQNDFNGGIVPDLFVGHLPYAELLCPKGGALRDQVGAAYHFQYMKLFRDRVQIFIADHAAADQGGLYSSECHIAKSPVKLV